MKNWIYGETIDNSPYNMDNVFKDEIEIRSRLDQYRDTVVATERMFGSGSKKYDIDYEF